MANENRFKQGVVVTLARRAANRCSNPDCRAITSGPSDDRTASINVGEAAHIYGANPGSARYDPAMASVDRSDITNAIWLCGNCHKLVDDDPSRYPPGLLFDWQREHERMISEQIGKAGAEARERYQRRHLEEFGKLSYLAERLIIEKGDAWEYKLTAEILRAEMSPIVQRWRQLKRGLYIKAGRRIAKADTIDWVTSKYHEMGQIAAALSELMNVEIKRAWGAPGVSGVDTEIVATSRLFAEACASALAWEEEVQFSRVDDIFEELRELAVGVAGGMIDEAAKVPEFFAGVFAEESPSGERKLSLTLDMPEGWSERMSDALKRAERAYLADIRAGA